MASTKEGLRSFFSIKGNNTTANQAAARFGVTPQTVRARISELRSEGVNITLKTRTTSNGFDIQTYQNPRARRTRPALSF